MKVKILMVVNVILFSMIIFMGVHMYRDHKARADEREKINIAVQNYNCLENPVDPLFADALTDSSITIEYSQIQQLYYDTWAEQYDAIMEKIRKKCIYDEDIANFNLFTNEIEKGFQNLQPLVLNEMLDNYHIPKSPEKDSWGNGTQETLLMYQGTMYRNACMFFIPFLETSEYTFPINEVKESLSKITGDK